MKIKYHHHDIYEKPYGSSAADNVLTRRLKKAVCIVYSEQYGSWQLAINYDGTITLPVDPKEEAEDLIITILGLNKKKKGFFA